MEKIVANRNNDWIMNAKNYKNANSNTYKCHNKTNSDAS